MIDGVVETEFDTTDTEAVSASARQVVVFRLGGQTYALPIDRVQEVQQIVAFSPVPSDGSAVVGMVNLRGEVIPAVDGRRLIGLPVRDYDIETTMIMARVRGRLLTLVVDRVDDVVDVSGSPLLPVPSMHALSAKTTGVIRTDDGLVYVLDVDALLGPMVDAAGD